MSLYVFHLGQIISSALGQVDHDSQHGNAASTPILDETSETDQTQKLHFRHSGIYQTIKALAILRCLYGSEMVAQVLGVVIGKSEISSTDISQENDHAILLAGQTSICGLQFQINSSGPTGNIIGTYLSILSLFWCNIVNICDRNNNNLKCKIRHLLSCLSPYSLKSLQIYDSAQTLCYQAHFKEGLTRFHVDPSCLTIVKAKLQLCPNSAPFVIPCRGVNTLLRV